MSLSQILVRKGQLHLQRVSAYQLLSSIVVDAHDQVLSVAPRIFLSL